MSALLVACVLSAAATALFVGLLALLYFSKRQHLAVQEVNALQAERTQLFKTSEALSAQQLQLELRNLELEKQVAAQEARLENYKNLQLSLEVELEKKELEKKSETAAHQKTQELLGETRVAQAQLTSELEQKQLAFERQIKQLADTREDLKKEFELLANGILETKTKVFKEQNTESIAAILNPLKDEMKQFKDRVEKIHTEDVEQTSALRTELLNLQSLNKDITEQAAKLTNALRSDKKKLGNWGELVLSNVLEASGLRHGEDYTTQKAYTDADGERVLPDAIVRLPKDKHIVIDAKTSLNAYTDYVNCDDPEQRQIHLAAHAKAVGDRINELADKNYFKIPGLNTPEIVIMFIPVESAYIEALRYNNDLYQRAIRQNVLVATPITLLTSLNIVHQLWRFEEKNSHTEELAKRAESFYNKLNSFLTKMLEIGKQLDRAKETYSEALGQFCNGKGNLIKQAAEFKELGLAVQKDLPTELVDKARLELDLNSEIAEIS